MYWAKSCLCILGSGLVLAALPSEAQSVISARSGLVQYVEGQVFFDGRAVAASPSPLVQMKPGRWLRTAQGRAEVLLSPGIFLRVAENTSVRLVTESLTDVKLQLLAGSIFVDAAEWTGESSVTVFAGGAAVSLQKAGLYRLDTEPPVLRIREGRALVDVSGEQKLSGKGTQLALDTGPRPQRSARERNDAFEEWNKSRAEMYRSRARQARASLAADNRLGRVATGDASVSMPPDILSRGTIPRSSGRSRHHVLQ